jgi:hypothetical protein
MSMETHLPEPAYPKSGASKPVTATRRRISPRIVRERRLGTLGGARE